MTRFDCENSYTFRLFKKTPSFVGGVAALVDIFGKEEKNYILSRTEEEADLNAIYSDWKAVGSDMSKTVHNFKMTYKRK